MKRLFLAITCAIMLVIPTLSGCGSKEQTSEDVKASSDVSKEKTESVEEKAPNIDGGSSGSVFATGADWLSKVPKLNEPLGITLGQTYYDDYNMPSVEVIPANDLWEMNDDNGNSDLDMLFFPRTPLYFRNNLDDIRMDVDDQDDEQNEENENELWEEDYSEGTL